MIAIKAYCTIVNLRVETGHWATIPSIDMDLPGVGKWARPYWRAGAKVTQDSGWDQRSIVATMSETNGILAPAGVEFKPEGFKTIEIDAFNKSGVVDDATYFFIASTLAARGFTPGEVKIAFVREMAGDRGRAAEELCFAGVTPGTTKGQGAWVLAHELGHLLGLAHECADDTRTMFWAWKHGIGQGLTKGEIATIAKHPHVDRRVRFTHAAADVVCRR